MENHKNSVSGRWLPLIGLLLVCAAAWAGEGGKNPSNPISPLAPPPADFCGFGKFKKWDDFLKFSPKPEPYFSYKSAEKFVDVPIVTAVDIVKVGDVTSGECKGSEIYVGRQDTAEESCDYDGKPSPGSVYVFGGNFKDSEAYTPFVLDDLGTIGGDCHPSYRLIKRDNILYGSSKKALEIEPLIQKKFPGLKMSTWDASGYDKSAFGSEATIAMAGTKDTFLAKLHPYAYSSLHIDSKFPMDQFKIVGEDRLFGKIAVRGLESFVIRPDHIVFKAELGLSQSRNRYWFFNFLGSMSKSFQEIEKFLSPVKGESGWYEVSDEKSPQILDLYKKYKDRVGAANSELEQDKQHYELRKIETLDFKKYFQEKPVLFFKDPLGRFQVFRKILEEVPNLAEPLVYIYSTEEIELEIQTCPNLEAARTIPPYSGRWKVRSTLDGKIVDLASLKKYPYLFWEGFAGHIPPYPYGWVVESGNVPQLFDRILPLHGLTSREVGDFKKYWVPRMQRAPYYRVELLPQSLMDSICPLRVQPIPNSFLRVHMRAYELEGWEAIEAPKLPKKFERNGLTVVEWGGILN